MGRAEPAWGRRGWGDAAAGALLWSQNSQPTSLYRTMDEIKLEPSLKYLHCQEDCGGGFRSPLSPAILFRAGLAL